MPLPQKNKADTNWLDRVPPTMLRDIRQSLQAPVHIGLLLISVLFTYLCCAKASSAAWSGVTFFTLLITAGLIPIHIGMNVAADIKAGSSNFLKLCPLPAGKIIWGQFLSGIAQMGVVLLLLSPLYLAAFGHLCQYCNYQPYFWGAERSLGSLAALAFLLMLLCSCLALALSMMLAWLPMVLRLVLQMALGIAYLACDVALSNNYQNLPLYAPDFVAYFPALFIGGILATITCLLLARRHYQAATEHKSGGVRLIALLMLGVPALNESLIPTGDWAHMLSMTVYALIAALILLLLDELMPKQAGSRPIKSLPSLLCMVGLCVLSVASFPLIAHGGLMPAQGQTFTTASTLLVYAVARLMAGIFFCLACCQLFLPRTSKSRLLSFLIAWIIFCQILMPMLGIDKMLGILSFSGFDAPLAPELLQDALSAGKVQGISLLILVLTTIFGPLHWARKSKDATVLPTTSLSAAPSRKGKKKLLDYLPASLVLDMRQLMRSPLYILASLVAIAWIYQFFWETRSTDLEGIMATHIGLLLIISLRASNKVARDIREGGSNFLQLCPLPAWRIIAGQFGAAVIQMLALSLLLLPLYLRAQNSLPVEDLYDNRMESYFRHCATAPALMPLQSLFMGMLLCAGAMVLACLPILFRAIALAFTTAFICSCNIDWVMDLPFKRETGWMADVALANSLVVFAVIQALLFSAILLLLCSRYYSSSVEDAHNAAWVKCLSWLSMLLGVAMFIGLRCSIGSEAFIRLDEYSPKLWQQMGFCFLPYLAIYLTDEMLPRKGESPSHGKLINLLLMMVVFIGSTLSLAWLTQGWSAASTPLSNKQLLEMCYYPIALVGSFCLPLGFTKLLLSNSRRYQILTYGIATCLIAIVCIGADYAPFGCLDLKLSESLNTANFVAVVIGTLISLGFVWLTPKLNPREQ